jgi:methyltransferase
VRGRGSSSSLSCNGSLSSALRNGTPCGYAPLAASSSARLYPLMVALHTFWLLGLGLLGHDRSVDPIWLAVFILLQAGRLWVIASLGRRWTTRVIVLPGAAPIACGPYRWLRHPNYVVVVLEIAVVPLALGLPIFALVSSLANVVLLAYRIAVENQALAWAMRHSRAQ